MGTYTEAVQKLYVAYFNRPADAAGLTYWEGVVAAAGGKTAAVSATFAASAEYKAAFAGQDEYHVVATIYQNLFGRAAEPAGLTYWGQQLINKVITVDNAVTQIALGAQGTDLVSYNDKVAAATAFSGALTTSEQILAYSGDAANAIGKAFIAGVTDADSLAAAIAPANLANVISTVVGAPHGSVSTFTLTTGQDTLIGGAGNDVFNAGALNGGTGTLVDSLQNVDTINGGGGNDTLNVTLNDGAPVTPSLVSVENIVLRSTNGAGTLDLSASTGVTNVTVAGSTQTANVAGVHSAKLAVANQVANANFFGATGTTTNLSLNAVGTSSSATGVSLNYSGTAATTLALTANNAFVTLSGDAAKTVTIAAAGSNALTLGSATTATSVAVTGAGFVDLSGAALSAATSVTAADGGLKATITNATAQAVTVTTGAGADTISAVGAGVKSISTGAGNDKLTTVTSAVGATATINLGAGDDSATFTGGVTAGATINGGDGTDTIGLSTTNYGLVSAFAAADLAKITNFEVLSISDALAAGTYDVSKIAGIGSFVAAAGITTGAAAIVTGLGANASVTLAGPASTGTIALNLKAADTGADVLNLKLNHGYTQNHDTVVDTQADIATAVTASTIETLNVNSTGKASVTAGAADALDKVTNTLTLTDDSLTTLNITGNQKLVFASTATMVKLATIDASANTGGTSIDVHLAAVDGSAAAITITGSATAGNTIVGSGNADVIVGGAKSDTITGGAGGDTLTGGAGNDKFVFSAGDSTIAAGKADTITDFHANTVGAGLNGAVTAVGATGVAATSLTGDLLVITHMTTTNNGVTVGVYSSASDVQTFLQTQSATEGVAANQTIHAGLNSTTGDLYIDIDGNGTADLYIHLTGVTTLNAAAFIIA